MPTTPPAVAAPRLRRPDLTTVLDGAALRHDPVFVATLTAAMAGAIRCDAVSLGADLDGALLPPDMACPIRFEGTSDGGVTHLRLTTSAADRDAGRAQVLTSLVSRWCRRHYQIAPVSDWTGWMGRSGVVGDVSWRMVVTLPAACVLSQTVAEMQAALDAVAQWSMVQLLQLRGPVLGDALRPVDDDGASLARWARRHYAAAGIDDPDSLREIARAETWRVVSRAPAMIRVASPLLGGNATLVACYAALMQAGVPFPPLIARHRGHLREGYHRRRAAIAAGLETVAVVEFT